ncbi:unnamed protein product, partial [marine sediment metagenome]
MDLKRRLKKKVYSFGVDGIIDIVKKRKAKVEIAEQIIVKRESSYEKLKREEYTERLAQEDLRRRLKVKRQRGRIQSSLGRKPVKTRLKAKRRRAKIFTEVQMREDGTQALIELDENQHRDVKVRKKKRAIKLSKRFSMAALYRALAKVETEGARMNILEHFVRTA